VEYAREVLSHASRCECMVPHDALKSPDRRLENPVSSSKGGGDSRNTDKGTIVRDGHSFALKLVIRDTRSHGTT